MNYTGRKLWVISWIVRNCLSWRQSQDNDIRDCDAV